VPYNQKLNTDVLSSMRRKHLKQKQPWMRMKIPLLCL